MGVSGFIRIKPYFDWVPLKCKKDFFLEPIPGYCTPFITARKRSLGQGNIFIGVCQEFCSPGGCLVQGVPVPGGGVWSGGWIIIWIPSLPDEALNVFRKPGRFHV